MTTRDKQQQAKENKELKERFNDLKRSINNNLDKLGQSANDILMDNFYHLVDYIRLVKTNIDKIVNYRNIYILEFLDIRIKEVLLKASDDDFVKLEITEINSLLDNYQKISQEFLEKLNEYFDIAYQDASLQVNNFSKLNDIYKNQKTYRIYKKVEQINNAKYNFYISFAIGFGVIGLLFSIFGKVVFTQCFFGGWCILEYNSIDYWIMKASIIFITITGVTFCLKQAIHHQKKRDRAEQTRLELEALPTYMFNFSDEQKNQVYAELTSKYFGRDFDKEGYQDMSNLVQEQIKLSHEVLKTTIANQQNGNKS